MRRRRLRLSAKLSVLAVSLGLLGATLPVGASGTRAGAGSEDLARHVDPMIGTYAPGFTVPGAATPFGMVQVSPDTEGPFAYSGYLWSDPTIRGFSNVHLSGPGVPKAGDIPLMPTVGPVVRREQPRYAPEAYASPFDHASEEASPGFYRVTLPRYGVQAELSATQRVGLQRYTFPPAPQANVLIDASRSVEGLADGAFTVVGDREVVGYRRGRYPVFFVARFDRPFTATGTWTPAGMTPGGTSVAGTGVGGWVSFDTTTARVVTARVGISFVDVEGARRNLEQEAAAASFDEVRATARASWNAELSRIRVDGGGPTDRASFYTALYHALLHPNVFNDVDGRYRGFDNAIHVVTGRDHYANFSSWDTYKAQNQLLATLHPARYREMLLSLLADAKQGGKLPRWGEQNRDSAHMSGDPVIPMIVDGYCRGVFEPADAADVVALYAKASELATVHRSEFHRANGYIAGRPGTTLEHGVADFALALMADALGKHDERDQWLAQSLNYRNVFDPETRWVRPRSADGSWHTPFDPTEETGFQEGNSWQYSWLAPHDARGVYDRMGGDDAATARLDQLFAHELSARVPVAVAEAHSRLNVFGLVYRTATYAPGNEHDLQVPWMYPFARQPWKTQAVLRQIQGIFRATPDGLPGNDDLGSLSAWHVLSMLGFGPVTPGAPFYVVGSPAFTRAEIALPGGRTFRVDAPGASLTGKYVQSASLDGKPLERAWFLHDAVAAGKTLRLQMGDQPNTTWASGAGAVPPSVSDADLAAFGCNPE